MFTWLKEILSFSSINEKTSLELLEKSIAGFRSKLCELYPVVTTELGNFSNLEDVCRQFSLPPAPVIIMEIRLALTGFSDYFKSTFDAAHILENESAYILDLREPWEKKIAVISPYENYQEAFWADFLNKKIDVHATIFIFCHFGIKSPDAVQKLRELGYQKSYAIHGGIDAWSTQIDSSVRRYDGEWC